MVDFTSVWTTEGWLLVAVVIDLFSRRVVGWLMGSSMTAQLVADALVMTIRRRGKPQAVLHRSDRGSQYSGEQLQRLMAWLGVPCSMSRSGNVWDNAAMENFFSSLKQSGYAAASTAPSTRHAPMCSTASSASSTQGDATRSSAISALWISRRWPRHATLGVH